MSVYKLDSTTPSLPQQRDHHKSSFCFFGCKYHLIRTIIAEETLQKVNTFGQSELPKQHCKINSCDWAVHLTSFGKDSLISLFTVAAL